MGDVAGAERGDKGGIVDQGAARSGFAILRHRVVLSYAAEADAVTADRVTQDMLRKVPCPGLSDRDDRPSWIRRVFEAIWYGPERRRSA